MYEGNVVEGEQVDPNDAYWAEFGESKKAVENWKNSPEYESDMAALRAKAAQLDAKGAALRRQREALGSVRLIGNGGIPMVSKAVESAFIAECIGKHDEKNRGQRCIQEQNHIAQRLLMHAEYSVEHLRLVMLRALTRFCCYWPRRVRSTCTCLVSMTKRFVGPGCRLRRNLRAA